MGLNIGQTPISDVKLGVSQVDKIYLGNEVVWSKVPQIIKAIKFESSEAQTLGVNSNVLGTITPSFQYSLDGTNWTNWDNTTSISFGDGTDLYLRGSNTILATSSTECVNFVFSTSSPVACSGNIMHLFDYTQDLDAFPNDEQNSSQGVYGMFKDCSVLTTPPSLPATSLVHYCYGEMFRNCTSMTTAPELPATTLAEYCYYNMFRACTSLTTAPALPSTNLAANCYREMFRQSGIVSSPHLASTTVQTNCYYQMYQDCTSLETLTELPATTLASGCYTSMYRNCTKIKMSTTQVGDYVNVYTFGATPVSANASSMFLGTGGTFTGTPTSQTYYTSNTIITS